jgi:hypothetical protein
MERPKNFILEGSEEDFANFDDVPYSQEVYFNPIQIWIEENCIVACHLVHDFDVLVHLHVDFPKFNLTSMKIPTFVHIMTNVSLFRFITKHKGRSLYVNKEVGWLHWSYDYT